MKPNTVSIIIIGNWNPRIFTPSWIKLNLFSLSEDADLQGLVNFEDLDFAFKYEGIVIIPKFNSIEINIEDYEEDKGILVGTIATKILELLPQTPIKALGVNIGFLLHREQDNRILKVIKEANLNFDNFQFTQLKHTLNKEKYQVNIITEILGEVISVVFNFHYSKIPPFDPQFLNNHFEETKKILIDGT